MKNSHFAAWLLVWLVTQVVGILSVTFLFTLGLILIEFLSYPLALGVSALLVGLTAVWTSNRLVRDDLQAPADGVVLRSEITAVVLSLLLIAGGALNVLPSPPIVLSLVAATILAIVATISARQLRRPPTSAPHQTRRIVIWLAVALLSIPIVIFVASLFGWAGA